MIENKLKTLTTAELENIIAQALSEKTGDEFQATLSSLNFKEGAWPAATITVTIAKSLKIGNGE